MRRSRSPKRSLSVALVALSIAMVGTPLIDVAEVRAQSTQDDAQVTRPTDGIDGRREAELDAMTARIGATLRCPICRQQSVAESSARISREMQGIIRNMLVEGKTPEEIEAYFVQSYGPWILLRPKPEGANLLVYLGPLAVFVGGGLLIFTRLRRNQREAPDATVESGVSETPARDPIDGKDRRWLDAALRGS